MAFFLNIFNPTNIHYNNAAKKKKENEAGSYQEMKSQNEALDVEALDVTAGLKQTAGRNILWPLVVVIVCIGLVSIGVFLSLERQIRDKQPMSTSTNKFKHIEGTNKRKPVVQIEVACLECYDALPDECRLIPLSFTTLGKEHVGQRYNRWHYNGNMGSKSDKFESQTSAGSAVRALLGDITARKESLVFRWVRDAVLNRNTTFDSESKHFVKYSNMVGNMTEDAWSFLESYYALQRGVDKVTGIQSLCATEYAMNYYFRQFTKEQVTAKYINYTSSSFDNDGATQVWTTVYQEVAPEYGPLVVVFKPEAKRPRSIDLNLWNLAHNGFFTMRNNATWDDTGEFITPGYKYSSDIEGFLLFKPPPVKEPNTTEAAPLKFCNATKVRQPITEIPYHNLYFAFFKEVSEGKPYVVVLDGHMESGNFTNCIELGSDGYHHHCQYVPWEFGVPEPKFPKVLSERCRAIGFLCAASSNKRCKPPKALKKKYRNLISEYTLSTDTLDYLMDVTWEDPYKSDKMNHLSFYPLNTTAIAGKYASNVLLEKPPYVDPKGEKCVM